MNYYKLEAVQEALRLGYGAERVSVGPKPRVEVWARTVAGHSHKVALAWEHGEEILSEEELFGIARGLSIVAADLLEHVKDNGGLWLGPSPPTG